MLYSFVNRNFSEIKMSITPMYVQYTQRILFTQLCLFFHLDVTKINI